MALKETLASPPLYLKANCLKRRFNIYPLKIFRALWILFTQKVQLDTDLPVGRQVNTETT
jgi:hypothetical protein